MSAIKSILRAVFIPSLFIIFTQISYAAVADKQPITVNGDTVEFKTEGKEMVAQGNVEVTHQDTKLICDKVRVFIDQKIAIAEGHVKMIKPGTQELSGDMIIYDFSDQTGTIINPSVRMPPYYGKAQSMERISENEFLMTDGDISTCDLPHPHWLLSCHEVKMKQPERLLTAKGVKVSILDVPLMYLPEFSQRLTDTRPRFMITPGHKSDLGQYLLGAWRYYLNQSAKGVVHFDWYQNRGWAEGVDLNYVTKSFGNGNAKYYRIDETNNSKNNPVPPDERERNERSKIELRHRWDTATDHLVLEYFRESDVNFRKDYFFREYERVTNPDSFLLLSHVYPNATLSFQGHPRVNKFDSVVERIPELKLETVNQRIGLTPFYYKNTTSMSHLVNAPANAPATPDVSRIDTANQLSYIFRLSGLDFGPFIGERETFYSKGINTKDNLVRDIFFGGMNVSTKLFKIYNVQSNFMNLNVNQLRHIITPSVQYTYQKEPNILSSRLIQFDDIDALDKQNTVTLSLENRLQTKRRDVDVDLITLILSTNYNIEKNITTGTGFQTALYHLELRPYEAWALESEAEYDTVGNFFRSLTADLWSTMGKANTTLGYRYKKGESSQVTFGFNCPLNPFWKVGVYERFEFKTGSLMEQEYTLDRDLHCWTVQFIIDQSKGEGISFLVAFKLKAFPNLGINAQKTFSPPRTQ